MGDFPRGVSNTQPALIPSSDNTHLSDTISTVAYAAPVTATIFLLNPIWSILPGIYAKYFNIELTAIAAVILFSRLFDGITDPAIGYLSDRHRSGGGSRKLWVIVGGVLLVVTSYFLFIPPEVVSQTYFLLCLLSFFFAFTLFEIPHGAWGAELAVGYHERARVFSYRTAFVYLGQIGFLVLPFLPVFTSREYTPETLRIAFYVGAALMLCTLSLNVILAPDGQVIKTRNQDNLRMIIRSVALNKPLLLFMTAFIFAGTSFGMWTGLLFIYLDGYLNLADKIATILLLGNIAGLLSIPLWLKLIQSTNKSLALVTGMLFYTLLLAGCLFVKPGISWLLSMLFVGGVYTGFACLTVAAPAMLGDIADYGVLKFKKNRTATYFAVFTLFYKVTLGLGSGLALAIAGHFEFDAAITTQTDTAIFGLRLAFIILPVLCALIALIFIFRTPINEHRHNIIRRRIESRSVNNRVEVFQ